MDAKPLSHMDPLEARLKAEAARLGFADCRITHADAIPENVKRDLALLIGKYVK